MSIAKTPIYVQEQFKLTNDVVSTLSKLSNTVRSSRYIELDTHHDIHVTGVNDNIN